MKEKNLLLQLIEAPLKLIGRLKAAGAGKKKPERRVAKAGDAADMAYFNRRRNDGVGGES